MTNTNRNPEFIRHHSFVLAPCRLFFALFDRNFSRPLGFILCLSFIGVVGATAQNRVLELDGSGDPIQLPSDIFNDLNEATVEGFLKLKSFNPHARFFDFGKAEQRMGIHGVGGASNLRFYLFDQNRHASRIESAEILRLDQWYHIAVVSSEAGMKLYLNGTLAGNDDDTGRFSSVRNGDDNASAKPSRVLDTGFQGQMDEIRVWKIARTQQQIRETMHVALTGRETNLVGLWNFDAGDAQDSSPNGSDGQLIANARCVFASLPTQSRAIVD